MPAPESCNTGHDYMEVLHRTEGEPKRSCKGSPSKEDLDTARNAKLREIARRVRLDGIRAGKAPLEVVKRSYGNEMEVEARKQAITSACRKFLNDEEPSLSPTYTTEMLKDKTIF